MAKNGEPAGPGPSRFGIAPEAAMLQALAEYRSGRLAQAEEICRRLLSIRPGDLNALNLLSFVCERTGRAEEGLQLLESVLAARPHDLELHTRRGNALRELGCFPEALASYDHALAIKPDYAVALSNRGIALHALRRYEDALDSYARALDFQPGFIDAHLCRGVTLWRLSRLDKALACFERVLQLQPDHPGAHNNRGLVLAELGRWDAALESYARALHIHPDFAEAHVNRGVALQLCHDLAAAYASFTRAIALQPGLSAAHECRAYVSLARGDFPGGWRDHEQRRVRIDGQVTVERQFSMPRWQGREPLRGRRILLHAEQGLGDTIQFCRYASLVADLGATVILEVQGPLVKLLGSLAGVAEIAVEGAALPAADYHCPLMSLPFVFDTTLDSIPARIPYLSADPAKVRAWQERLGPKRRPRIGLVWSGGFRPNMPELAAVNVRRNISLSLLAPLRNADVEFHSLQKGQPAEGELASAVANGWDGPQIIDHTHLLRDFTDTAALIGNLDLIISVDTSTAHLAGALGKPVWLLNRFDSCWRWLLQRTDSPWYPTFKLYRQAAPGDWPGVVEAVRADLDAL